MAPTRERGRQAGRQAEALCEKERECNAREESEKEEERSMMKGVSESEVD